MATIEARIERNLDCVELSALAGRRLFVTGGTGFVGSWLLRAIARMNRRGAGIRVTALSRSPERFREAQPELAAQDWLRVLRGEVCGELPARVDADLLIHGAAPVRPAELADPAATLEVLLGGTRAVLELARRSGIRRVLCLSSGAACGALAEGESRFREGAPSRLAPDDAYGVGKLAMEALALAHGNTHRIDTVIARLFAFCGPGLPEHLALSQLLAQAARGGPLRLDGDGSPVRSFLDAGDMALWLLALLANGRPGEICNVGSDQELTLAELATEIAVAFGCGPVQLGEPGPPGARPRYVPDLAHARGTHGLELWTPREVSLAAHLEWLRAR